MLNELREHIDANLNFLQGKKLLIACSGGLDSVVLTLLINELGYEIGLAHCNFSLRGAESDGDEAFVSDLANKMDSPYFSETFDTEKFASENKLSTQMAARELRYNWFEEIRKDFKYDFVLTAHHADDELETFLINLSRGTGLRGLTGIKERNNLVIRPLLPFTREEILTYAKKQQLYWREDSSNEKTDYLRNALRKEVIPKYKESAPALLQNLKRTQAHLLDSGLLLEDYLALIYKLVISETAEGYSIDILKLTELPNTNALLYELLHPFGFTAWKDISELLGTQSGKFILSGTHRLLKDRHTLLLTQLDSEEIIPEKQILKDVKEIHDPLHLTFTRVREIEDTGRNMIYVDSDKLNYPLTVRRWKEGDVFHPFGMQGKKKLSKFFKDEKLSLVAKEKIWVLTSDQQIVWVINHRLDDRYKVTSKTTDILKIRFNA